MKRITSLALAILIAVAALGTVTGAQTQTGIVEGKVTDEQGAVLPGVTVTLTGPRGSQAAVTDPEGMFRFVGISPGTYSLKTSLTGFASQERSDVTVGMGKTFPADFTLKIGGMTDSIEVTGTSSGIDVKSSATDSTLSNNLLQMTPIYSSTSTGLLNAAPGINSSSAFGGQASYGNALLLDGVDTRDPEGGSAWTFFNQNLIEEIQIGGLGAAAEYGGFTGGIINTVTKSGGNLFSGLFSMRYTTDSLASKNISDSILEENPGLGESAITKKLNDYTVQMGGPIKRDKAFFFGSVQRYYAVTDPIGPVANSRDISPRFNGKLTLQPRANDTIILGGQYDQYNLNGRVGYWPASQATDQQTVEEDAPEWVWNAQWRHIFGSSTLLESKLTGYTGYYYLDPIDPSPFTYNADTGAYSGGGGGQYYADRSRNQAQVSLTKFADKFGKHSLKFGAEIERSHVRSQYQPYGPAGFYIYESGGHPYARVSYGYDLQGDNRRTSVYAQDQLSAGRVTLNLGLRMDHIRGSSPILDRDVYTPKTSWGPRLGMSYDLTGNGTSAFKAFWGRYYEGAASAFFTSATPGIQDYTYQYYDANGNLTNDIDVIVPAVVYGIDPDIKHPKTDEFNVSFETQLIRGMRFTATGVWRDTGNFINNVINDARFSTAALTNALTGQPLIGYSWANRGASSESFFIRNQDGFQYRAADGSVIATATPERKYRALILQASNQLRNRLGYQVSYVLAKAEGNVDNTGFGNWLGGTAWNSPNTAITNAYGELTNSRRHEMKAYLTYQIPRIDILLGGSYTGLSGRPYAAFGQFSANQLNLPGTGRRQIFLEPRGSRRNDFFHQIDLRAEKAFRVQTHRLGIYADINNLMNTASITARQSRYPNTTIADSTVLFGAPTGVQGSRQVTLGARWSF